jgi:hypothetical protein
MYVWFEWCMSGVSKMYELYELCELCEWEWCECGVCVICPDTHIYTTHTYTYIFTYSPTYTHYTHTTHRTGDPHCLYVIRNWELQGSHTGNTLKPSEWVTLKKHENDISLSASRPYSTAHWNVESTCDRDSFSHSYRFFRIFQTGYNSHMNYVLSCSGLELYGVLTTVRNPC